MLFEKLPLVNEISSPGRRGVLPPSADQSERRAARAKLPANLRRKAAPALPEVSELDAMRHFTRLSQKNYSIDAQFYPLGSCTMKYNPRINEKVAAMAGFARLHPMQESADIQGSLRIFHDLQEILKQVLGLGGVTLCPAAGAQGEFAGMAIIRAYHRDNNTGRDEVIIPDSAHGTNPASAAFAGFKVREVKSGADGCVDLDALRAAINDKTAAIMLTNPNTCGLFEKDIKEIARMIHAAGGLLYYDGANLNAIVGRARPGDMGFDVVHMNLHKTFSTPHGGGGPGAGPVGVAERLINYLPAPHVRKAGSKYEFYSPDRSIGKLLAFHANAGVIVRALSYAMSQGGTGLWDVATYATLNANYVLNNLPAVFERPFGNLCKHEALVTVRRISKEKDIKAFDIAKRLLDLGYHAPTIYFPLLVPECLLIEPTETESKETLDGFIAAMKQIATEIESTPDVLRNAPNELPTGRMDEAAAAKALNVCCQWGDVPMA
ncbi:aminomethyl-transferring glycine dehydrogenase subunit GcvPB [Candidatus Sumerlaeota bacterium]|nr:aminomethyl-transferring glycine dehydrogenase subunit GcvPB [Candidatus Sumerlaeota bacterium]